MKLTGKEWTMIAAILAASMLVPVNSTIIAVGLSAIASTFGESLSQISWVVTVYLIVMAVTQPIAGKLGDIYGNGKVLMAGLVCFLVASIACAFSFHPLWLIVFRGVQALGGALMTPNAIALIRFTVPRERLGTVMGTFGLTAGLGAAAGPLIGSLLIGTWGWQSMFWVNVPFLVFSILACIWALPATARKDRVPLDLLGSVYLAVGFTLLILLFKGQSGFVSLLMVLGLLISAVLFTRHERRISEPLIDFALFKRLPFVSANLSILCSNFVMYGILLAMPLLLESQFQMDESQIGYVLVALTLSMTLISPLGGYLTDRLGKRPMVITSFVLTTIAAVLLWVVIPMGSLSLVVVSLVVAGVGCGIGMGAMQLSSLDAVEQEKSGIASGIFSTFRYFGSMIASALIAITAGSSFLFGCFVAAAFAGIVISLGIRKHPSAESQRAA
ncbi:MFS transporter [Desmospora activa]|uniref:EmrB/QacA subfamily drug resistance transporter n=1 Tax=Desmospora activa DSM 45169 TaxID=1121389 RepID=A0A2T4Z768_9BACL|nr:MFS transporter [Desmospora activa]PTM57748.1 EmrB/QacA subfamily drug resistance transporter [Desmospora activa DSM 45169]